MGKQPPEKPTEPEDTPPEIPPRMKKKGPPLPEKPPHMRAQSSQLPHREPLRPRILNLEQPQQREVLVAASKAVRERPVDRRQREPPKLLKPTSGGAKDGSLAKADMAVLPVKGLPRLEDCRTLSKNPLWSFDEGRSPRDPTGRKNHRSSQPVLLIPRNLLTWGSSPISYTLWTQRDVGRGGGIKSLKHNPLQPKAGASDTSAARVRSGSVTRSGSLTSQGSSSSESGGETFPKSVLKKQKRASVSTKGSSSSRRVDQKKNVTFNAFATVQLMEE